MQTFVRILGLVFLALVLTGCGGGGGGAAPVNKVPTVNAGTDQSVDEQSSVTLSGTGSDSDGSIASYAWTQTAGPNVTLSAASSASTDFTAPAVGVGSVTLTFQLMVTDDAGATATDTVSITVNTTNQAPVANAGPDLTVDEQSVTVITGSGTDADGSVASYAWTQTGGPGASLNNASQAAVTVTAPSLSSTTTITLELTVTDDRGMTGTDSVIVTVNPVAGLNTAPVANAGANRVVGDNQSISLDGTLSADADGSIAGYAWSQTGGSAVSITNANTATPSFNAPTVSTDEIFTFKLVVTDNEGATGADSVNITVSHMLPITLSGVATFDFVPVSNNGIGLNYDGTVAVGIRWATVEAISGTTVVGTAVTDGTGNYSMSVPQNTNMFVRVKAEMLQRGTPGWDVTVVDNTNSKALYVLDSAAFTTTTVDMTQNMNANSGWGGSGYSNPRAAAPFALLFDTQRMMAKILVADANAVFPSLKIDWSVNNTGTDGDVTLGQIGGAHYDPSIDEVFLAGAENIDTDEYDDHVFAHEWAHYFEDNFSRSDSIGGAHSGGDLLDPRVALGEGWGNAWSAIGTGGIIYADTRGIKQGQTGVLMNLETGSSGGSSGGWYSETAVQSLIYDLYDTPADNGDTVALGITPIYNALVGDEKNTPAVTTIFSFLKALTDANPGVAADIMATAANEGINGSDEWATGETNDAGNTQDVLPVYSGISTDGTIINLCSTTAFKGASTGNSNKLSEWRYMKLVIPATGTYQITLSAVVGSDPDYYVLNKGIVAALGTDNSRTTGKEQHQSTLTAGTYTLIVDDDENTLDATAANQRTCIDISVLAM